MRLNAIERAFERLSAFSVCFTDENGRAFERLLGAFERLLGAFERPPGKKKTARATPNSDQNQPIFFLGWFWSKFLLFFCWFWLIFLKLVLLDFFQAGFCQFFLS